MSYQQDNLKAIADAIREKDGTFDPILPIDFPDRIRAIQTGISTDDATATANDILSPKTAYVKGNKITGNISSVTQATPSISVSSSGLITASATQSGGYVTAGTKSGTKQLTTVSGSTITPGTSQKTAVASGRYTTGAVYVAGDSNLVAANIKSGVSIFGVSGSLETNLDFHNHVQDSSTSTSATIRITTMYPVKIPKEYIAVFELWSTAAFTSNVFCQIWNNNTGQYGSNKCSGFYINATSKLIEQYHGTLTLSFSKATNSAYGEHLVAKLTASDSYFKNISCYMYLIVLSYQ